MRYPLEPNYRKYVEGHGFMSFARNLGERYGKKLTDGATKVSKDFAKTAGKRVVHKSAEATEDMIGNNIDDRISSKPRSKAQKDEDYLIEETQELVIPPEKKANH